MHIAESYLRQLIREEINLQELSPPPPPPAGSSTPAVKLSPELIDAITVTTSDFNNFIKKLEDTKKLNPSEAISKIFYKLQKSTQKLKDPQTKKIIAATKSFYDKEINPLRKQWNTLNTQQSKIKLSTLYIKFTIDLRKLGYKPPLQNDLPPTVSKLPPTPEQMKKLQQSPPPTSNNKDSKSPPPTPPKSDNQNKITIPPKGLALIKNFTRWAADESLKYAKAAKDPNNEQSKKLLSNKHNNPGSESFDFYDEFKKLTWNALGKENRDIVYKTLDTAMSFDKETGKYTGKEDGTIALETYIQDNKPDLTKISQLYAAIPATIRMQFQKKGIQLP